MVRKTVAKVTAAKSKKPFEKTVCLSDYTNGLIKREDGIWYANKTEPVSYPSKGYEACFEIEDQSFWFKHRNICIIELVKKFPPRGKGPIFDVGGGNGFVAKGLADAGWGVVLVEPGPAGARNGKKRGLQHVVCATTQTAGFKPGCIPAIGAFDVIEHIEDDVGFLRHLKDLLKPGGMLYLTVPAYNFLWSESDILAGHYRRYTLRALSTKLKTIGFEVALATYFFRMIPIAIFISRSLPFYLRLRTASTRVKDVARSHGISGGTMVRMMRWMLMPELKLIEKGIGMAFGGSCLVAARK